MVSVDPGALHLDNAVQATQSLFFRDLPAHVCVGPMPPGSLLVTDLPLKDLDENSPNIKHFLDLVLLSTGDGATSATFLVSHFGKIHKCKMTLKGHARQWENFDVAILILGSIAIPIL